MAKTVKIYLDFYVFVKNLLCSHILPFDRSPEKIHRHRSSFPVKNRKKSGIKVFLDAFFPRKNPVVTWTSVFKSMQKFHAKSQKFSRSNSETKKNCFSKLVISSEKSSGDKNYNFDSPLTKMLVKNGSKFDSQSPKTYQKKCLLIQLSFRQKACNFKNRVKK